MDGLFWILVMCAAVIGSYAIAKIRNRIDRISEDEFYSKPYKDKFDSKDEYVRTLDKWGERNNEGVSVADEYWPINRDVIDVVKNYEKIQSSQNVIEFDVNLMKLPYEDNPNFLQIGDWGDGSPVLIKKNSSDPKIYIDDIEECLPGNPRVLADTFEAYIKASLRMDMKMKEGRT